MSEDIRDSNIELVTEEGSTPMIEEPGANPVKMVMDRMHGRWIWAIALGCLLAPVFAYLGYKLAPVTYESTAVLTVESRLETLVEETPETREIRVDQEVQEQAQLLRASQVLSRALRSPELLAYQTGGRSGIAEHIADHLDVQVPRGGAIILVSMSDKDPVFAARAVNAIVTSYKDTFQPNRDEDFQSKVSRIQTRINNTRDRIDIHKRQKIEILRDSQYAITDVDSIMSSNVEEIRRLEMQIADIGDQLDRIREFVALRVRQKAEANSTEPTEDELKPMLADRVDPGVEELAEIDPDLPRIEEDLARQQIAFDVVKEQFGSGHMAYRRAKSNFEAKRSSFNARLVAAMNAWKAGAGSQFTWGALSERQKTLSAELEELRRQNIKLGLDLLAAEDLDEKINSETAELRLLKARSLELDRERDSIRKGRVDETQPAVPSMTPDKDRRAALSVAGLFGGCGIAFGIFFLVGSIDQKTFGVCQLEDSRNTMRVLGVMPDMDEVEEDGDSVMLATDCVHRIRARIESRRSPERGYAMMVSSPFQGDGKTTLAVSLGWSYAESGYKTLLLDADFIGRAMSHQFGHLRDPGLREIIRNGEVSDEIHELGHPNLSLLSVGFDRRISAANLSPRLMSRVLDAVRDDYDLVIIDSGPITASIEAIPVASASDGVVLTLRRGRSRGRLSECISDVRSVGADYLGLVLNYANKSDCIRHGSTSRMSVSVRAALEGGEGAALPAARNPMLDSLDRSED